MYKLGIKGNKKLVTIIVLTCITIVLLVSFVIANKNKLLTNSDKEESTVSVISQNTKTYKNTNFNFSINYPIDWFVNEYSDEALFEKSLITFSNYEEECSKADCPQNILGFHVSVFNKNDLATAGEFIRLLNEADQTATERKLVELSNGIKIKEFVITENDFDKNPVDRTIPSVKAFFETRQHNFLFGILTEIPSGSVGQAKEIEILEKSLKSFNLLDNG